MIPATWDADWDNYGTANRYVIEKTTLDPIVYAANMWRTQGDHNSPLTLEVEGNNSNYHKINYSLICDIWTLSVLSEV